MISQVVVAAKHIPVEDGIELATRYELGYEVPDFIETEALDDADKLIPQWQQYVAPVKGALALHGPVYDLNPVSLDPRIAEASRYRYEQAVRVSKALGCKYYVVHSQFNPIFEAANVKQEWLAASMDYWQQFAVEHLEDSPTLNLVIENFMEDDPGLLRSLVDGVNHPQVKACLDIGHANLFSRASAIQWMDQLEHQLVYLHSHNNHGQHDEHRGYDHGTIQMESFLNHLVKVPYKITLALEIFNEPELEESYALVQHYLNVQQEQLPETSFLI